MDVKSLPVPVERGVDKGRDRLILCGVRSHYILSPYIIVPAGSIELVKRYLAIETTQVAVTDRMRGVSTIRSEWSRTIDTRFSNGRRGRQGKVMQLMYDSWKLALV